MALKTIVKVGEVNNLSDARYCAGMGVEMLGFRLEDQHEHFVDPDKFREITEWVAGVKYVGEFDSADTETITSTLTAYQLDFIQTGNLEVIGSIGLTNIGLIYHIDLSRENGLSQLDELLALKNRIDYIVLENEIDPDHIPDKSLISTLQDIAPVLLACGPTSSNVETLLEELSVSGIALKGGEEIKPGIKDFDELADILELLEVDEAY